MSATATHNRKAYRNEKLSARFYFYSNLIGLKFSRCLQLLEREFDISESTICDIIAENNHIITHLERKQFSANDLKKYIRTLTGSIIFKCRYKPNQLRLAL